MCSPGHVGAQLETAASSPVKLNTVFRVATQPWPLYRVSYTYDFSGQRQIYIRGIGRVPAKGNLNYICSEDTIQFLDSEAGSVLYVVKLEHPVTLMGAPALSIPDETQFPGESRRGRWGGRGTFPEKAFEILNKTFPAGYRAYEKDKAISYLSTYAEVPVADDGTRTEVAILISYPAKSDAPDIAFTLAFTAQERRSHTDWRPVVSESARKSAEAFADGILNALQRP